MLPSPDNQHLCVDCGTDISYRRRDAQRCESCWAAREKERKRKAYLENRTAIRQAASYAYWQDRTPVLQCVDCGADTSHRARNTRLCESCLAARDKVRKRNDYWENRTERLELARSYYSQNRTTVLRRVKGYQQTPGYRQTRQAWIEENPAKFEVYRQRKRQEHREKTGYNPEGRTCGKCGDDISHRGGNAKWCVSCTTPPPRKCRVCHTDISHRGARAQFCSERCNIRHHEEKESTEYTKRCTACKETKDNAEFGWHNHRKRSVCKTCESNSQTERYHKFTLAQRERRNGLRREREEAKRVAMSPAEKAVLRKQRRKAYRLKRYGIDEDEWHIRQERKCAICERPTALEEMELDHDHDTKKPRGLLCKNCNFKLPTSLREEVSTPVPGLATSECLSCKRQIAMTEEPLSANTVPTRKQCSACHRWFDRTAFPPGRSRCRVCHRKASKISVRKSTLKHSYRITPEIYQAMYDAQDGKCYFCDARRDSRGHQGLVIDHDKNTNRVRGLLCRQCNAGWVDEYKRLPEQLQDSPRTNDYLLRGNGEYVEGIRQRVLSDKPDHELFAELQNEIFGNRTLPGNSADLIREAREIRDAETEGWA